MFYFSYANILLTSDSLSLEGKMVGPNMSNIQRFPCTYCMVQSATIVFVCRGWLGWGGGGGTPPSRAKPPQEKKLVLNLPMR